MDYTPRAIETRRRRRRKVAFKNYLRRNGCANCKVQNPDDLPKLTFHHLDRREKLFNIGGNRMQSWPALIAEVLKCCVLCFDCHKNIEMGLIQPKLTAISWDECRAAYEHAVNDCPEYGSTGLAWDAVAPERPVDSRGSVIKRLWHHMRVRI